MREEGPWLPYRVCSKCAYLPTDHQIYYNLGVCPGCGHISGSTIMDTETKVYRIVIVYKPTFWQFLKCMSTKTMVESKEEIDERRITRE